MSTYEPTNKELMEMVNRRKQADAEFRRMLLANIWNEVQNYVQMMLEQALAQAGVRWTSQKMSQMVKSVMDWVRNTFGQEKKGTGSV